ncbi:MAG: PilZ domain-containing protein [Phycisphaerae bacterium]|nr:PilZ domain-containing protein [Phycisphaerae bacterium]MBN8597085.1 PilZ domain-containing protein [Planctomycetota bacterium]
MNAINRRRFERFALQPMYTPVCVREIDGDASPLEGHAYDVSEGGIRFELDRAVAKGARVTMQITLPTGQGTIESTQGGERSVIVFGNVVWQDDSEPGPVRMALAITSFARLGDRERLLKSLGSGRYLRAA